MANTFKDTKVFQFANATIKVNIPNLTEEERKARIKNIHDAAARLLQKKG